jgi:hypothetical protein
VRRQEDRRLVESPAGLDRRAEPRARVQHPRPEGKDDRRLSAIAEGGEVGGQLALLFALVERKPGQADLRRPVGLRRPIPVGEQANDPLRREYPARDVANRLETQGPTRKVERAGEAQIDRLLQESPVQSPCNPWRPARQCEVEGHHGRDDRARDPPGLKQ